MVGMFKKKKTVSRRRISSKTSSQQKTNLKSRSTHRNPRTTSKKTSRELTGFGLIALGVFLLISLLTYHPTSNLANAMSYYSSGLLDIFPGHLGNLTGVIGVLIAGIIIALFGITGYMLPFMALQAGIKRLKGVSSGERRTSRLSVFLFLIMLSALFFVLSGENPMVGGISGEFVTEVLSSYFNGFGALLVILVSLMISAMKMTNLSILSLFSWSGIIFKRYLKKNAKGPVIPTDLQKQSREGFLGRDSLPHGPIITRYEFDPAPGIRVTRIMNLADDLALGLKASSLRVVAPVPGESVVGIEIPNTRSISTGAGS